MTRHKGGDKPKLRYKTHRAVDAEHEVITATKVTPGAIDEADMLEEMIESNEQNTQRKVKTVVADSRYGIIANYLYCHDVRIKAHIPSLGETQRGTGRKEGIFSKEEFRYNSEDDTYTCPGGHELKRRMYNSKRKTYEYKASSVTCAQCELRQRCTRAKDGRSVKRHMRQDALDTMLSSAKSGEAKRDIRTRQHLSERSFAQSKRYGYKRARWRRLWRMQIQDYLIAAVQNITILANHSNDRLAESNVLRMDSARIQSKKWAYFYIYMLIRQFLMNALWFLGNSKIISLDYC